MPELPDVETIRNELSPHVIGHQFIGVEIFRATAVEVPSAQEFTRRIIGQTIDEIARRGKYLLLRLFSRETLKTLHNIANKRNISIKALLLNQHAISGIGNIYADEALFYAGIHPLRRANTISREEIEHLFEGIMEVLKRGIKKGANRLPNRERGTQAEFRVAHRRGELCSVCGSAINWMKIAGRGTCFCPACQHSDTV